MTTKTLKSSFSFPSIKSLCLFLFILCVIDALSTDLGLSSHQIIELNPIMNFIYFNLGVSSFYFIKIGLPVILLYLHDKIRPKILYVGLSLTIFLYFGILFLHAHWMFVN